MTLSFILPAFRSALGLAWTGSAGPLAEEAAEQGIPWWMWLLIILALLAFAYVFYRWWRGSREEESEEAAAHAVVPEKQFQAEPVALVAAVEGTLPTAEAEVPLPAVELAEPAAGDVQPPAVELVKPAAEAEASLPAVELAEPALEPAALAPAAPDDLTLVEGIGPKIAGVLRAAGVTTFAQLADLDVTRIKEILERANPNLLRLADPTSWPEQARLAAAGQHEALKELQSQLRGGRQR